MKESDNNSGKSAFSMFLWLLLDAAVYLAAIYATQTFNLLHFDHIVSSWKYAIAAVAFAAVVFVFSAGYHRLLGKPWLGIAAAETALFFVIAVGPLMLMERFPAHKGMSIYWMPTEWLKIPRAIMFGARVSFPFFILFASGILAGFFAWLRSRFTPVIYAFICISAGISFYSSRMMEIDSRGGFYLTAMALPVVLLCMGVMMNRRRLAARSMLFLLAVNALLPFYFGVVPYFSSRPSVGRALCRLTPGCDMEFHGGPVSPAPGMTRIYPDAGEKPAFPMAFMRGFYFDGTRSMLFGTYGPTCGFIRLDTKTRRMDVMEYRSLIRYLWSEDALPYLVAPDWINADMLVVRKKSFNIERRIDLFRTGIRVPMSMASDENFLYVLSTEPPALARFEKNSLRPAGTIDFKKQGLTPHSHGAYALALDGENGRAFVQLGVYDFSGKFRLVRLNTGDFKTEAWKDIGTGSILMTALPNKRTVLMYDYYTHRVTEISEDTLTAIRSFEGVTNCRGAEYDEGRNLLYMVGAGLGELAVIDYKSGRKIRNYYIGNKAGALAYVPKEDSLFVGSGSGIYRVNLQIFTGMTKNAAAP
jgi:hypothetical protein